MPTNVPLVDAPASPELRRLPWGGPIVWYRPSIRRLVWRRWGFACLWVSLGSLCLGALRGADVDIGSAWLPLYAVGFAFVAAGPWQLFAGIQRVAREERVLSVHKEGLRWQDGAVVTHWTWLELAEVTVVDERVVIAGEGTLVTLPPEMDGVAASLLAATLIDLRRKALMGLPLRLALAHDRS